MTIDDIKEYIVCINGGSGVIFQPMDESYSYVLTAKHVIEDTADNMIQINLYDPDSNQFTSLDPFEKTDDNYYPHSLPEVDISIVRTTRLKTSDSLVIAEKDFNPDKPYLVGFPNVRRNDPIDNDSLRLDAIEEILHERENKQVEAKLKTITTHRELIGMSGGGLLEIRDDYLYLIGIQSQIPEADEDEQLGHLDFTPTSIFNEIVEETNGELEILLPSYLKCFSFLEEDVFKLNIGLPEKARAKKLTELLKKQASHIKDNHITPQAIKEYLEERLLLLESQEVDELQKRGIWSMWLELLTILNIARDHLHSCGDLDSIFKKVRLFYSNTNDDFWLQHLGELHKLDYSGLGDDGIVVVASNVEAKGGMHVLDLEKIPADISRLKVKYEDDKMQPVGQKIDSGVEFPLEKYRYMNISAFKEDTATKVAEKFVGQSANECLASLRGLYGQLIPHW